MKKNQIDEDSKYIKKKESSVSKSNRKAKHKHKYKECLFVSPDRYCRGTYCEVCGKVGDVHYFECGESKNGFHRILDSDEVFERYKSLEQKELSDMFCKYVSVQGE